MAAGPGGAAGPLEMLADPLAFGAQSLSEAPVSLAPDLKSGTVVLCVGAAADAASTLERMAAGLGDSARLGFVAAYALAANASEGAGLFLRRAQFLDRVDEEAFEPRSAAAGLGFGLAGDEGLWAFLAAASLRRSRPGSGGWEPDRASDPAGLVLHGAVVREFQTERGRALAGFAASLGRLEGPGLAARLQAETRTGPLLARFAAATSGPGFRELSGSRPERSLAVASDLRLGLRRASALALALRLESPANVPPLLGGSARLSWRVPLYNGGRVRSLEPRIEFDRKAGEASETRFGFALRGRRRGAGTNLDLSLGIGEASGLSGAKAAFESSTRDEGLGVETGFELDLGWLQDGDPSSPIVAEASLHLDLPLPWSPGWAGTAVSPGRGMQDTMRDTVHGAARGPVRGASLRLEIASPEDGLILAPRPDAEACPALVWSIKFVQAF